jgi:hypothetical protein
MRPPVAPSDPTRWDSQVIGLLEKYPRAWTAFCRFVFDELDAGETRVGAKAAWEHMRQRGKIELRETGDQWALNNSLCASFPRIFAATYPEIRNPFEIRKRPTESRAA